MNESINKYYTPQTNCKDELIRGEYMIDSYDVWYVIINLLMRSIFIVFAAFIASTQAVSLQVLRKNHGRESARAQAT